MVTTIQRWGNSQAVRLPKPILEGLFLREKDRVEISVERDSIVIKRASRKRRAKKSLEQRLVDHYEKPIDEILADDALYAPIEYDWGPPIGKEVW